MSQSSAAGQKAAAASLQYNLRRRPAISDIADLGYIDDSGMAPRLQPTALRLNRRLTEMFHPAIRDKLKIWETRRMVNSVIAVIGYVRRVQRKHSDMRIPPQIQQMSK